MNTGDEGDEAEWWPKLTKPIVARNKFCVLEIKDVCDLTFKNLPYGHI